MTPDQVEISRLKKSNESLSQKYADLEKRIADLEAKQQKAEREASRGPKF